jgi:hypothetical protein
MCTLHEAVICVCACALDLCFLAWVLANVSEPDSYEDNRLFTLFIKLGIKMAVTALAAS